jgi:PRTRC genetic system protein C
VRLADPDPTMKPDAVRQLYSDSYPHLAASTVSGPTVNDNGEVVYTFDPPPARTKG